MLSPVQRKQAIRFLLILSRTREITDHRDRTTLAELIQALQAGPDRGIEEKPQ